MYPDTAMSEPRHSLALREAASASKDANTSGSVAPPRKISWYDSSDDDDDDDEKVWLDATTIQERLSMLSSSTTCDTSVTDESRTDLPANEPEQESTSNSMVTFAMESTRVINYDPPSVEHHDDLFYKECELQRFREVYRLIQSLPKMKK